MSKNTKILVVDDEPVGRQLLEAILISEGFDILFAENGKKAYDIATAEFPDVILCDVMMPVMDGFEVCRKIRGNTDIAHIPVFLITALDDRDSRIKGIDAGADDYISKPFDRLEILAKVKNAATLLSFRKKSGKNMDGANKNGIGSDSSMVTLLLTTMLDTNVKINVRDQEIYRSHRLLESSHATWNIRTEKGDFICLLTNNLLTSDAALVNGVVYTLLTNNILSDPESPAQIVQNTLNQFKTLTGRSKPTGMDDLSVSLVLLHIPLKNKKIIVSGINNVVYISGGSDPQNNSSGKEDYQPYYLTKDQNITINQPKNACLFSGNIPLLLLKPELLSFLNTNFLDSTQPDYKEILESKFGISTDMIFIKIGF